MIDAMTRVFCTALAHQIARPFADCNGVRAAVIADVGLVECGQKARITARIIAARIGLCRRGHADYGGEACKHDKHSRRLVFVQIGAVVRPTLCLGPHA
jgi:hypothetical protein